MIAAISGAHTLGQAKQEQSGYKGQWTTSPGTFNNEYYVNMLAKGWGRNLAVAGNQERNQWKRIDGGSLDEFMLNSDLCLAYDNNLNHANCIASGKKPKQCKHLRTNGLKGEFLNAKKTECCAWTKPPALFNNGILVSGKQNEYCGMKVSTKKNNRDAIRKACCDGEKSDSTGDCDSAGWPKGPAFRPVLNFAADEKLWLKEFTKAWSMATQAGMKLELSNGLEERQKKKADRRAKRMAAMKAKREARMKANKAKRAERMKNKKRGKKSGRKGRGKK